MSIRQKLVRTFLEPREEPNGPQRFSDKEMDSLMINQSLRPADQAERPKALWLDLNRNIEILLHRQHLFLSSPHSLTWATE